MKKELLREMRLAREKAQQPIVTLAVGRGRNAEGGNVKCSRDRQLPLPKAFRAAGWQPPLVLPSVTNLFFFSSARIRCPVNRHTDFCGLDSDSTTRFVSRRNCADATIQRAINRPMMKRDIFPAPEILCTWNHLQGYGVPAS